MKYFFLIIFFVCSINVFSEDSYKVKKGDTLYSISRKFNIGVDELILINNLPQNGSIKIDQVIILSKSKPEEKVKDIYIVSKGDTLYSISRKFKIKIDSIKILNGLTSDSIKEGQKLYLNNVIKNPAVLDKKIVEKIEKNDITPPSGSDKSQNFSGAWPVSGDISYFDGKMLGIVIETKSDSIPISVCAGKVVWVGPYRGFENMIMVQSSDKMLYTYGGFDKIYFHEGDPIKSGASLGTLSVNSRDSTYKLFFFVHKDGKAINPLYAKRY